MQQDSANFIFCNSKSVSLFGFDLTTSVPSLKENNIALLKLNEPRFALLEETIDKIRNGIYEY